MLIVTFYQFGKRENSTKQPTETQSDIFTTYQCLLKDDTNILHPRLILRVESLLPWNPQNWTYAYIPDFSRYYFVENWEYVKPNWECILTIDPMASHKSSIGGESKYVLRAASDYNPNILDDAYSPTAISTISQNIVQLPYFADSGFEIGHTLHGRYILGVTGRPQLNDGPITYYVLTKQEFGQFANYLFTNILNMDWQDTSDWNAVISRSFIDPLDFIVSCFYCPFYLNETNFPYDVSPAGYPIKFGFWEYSGGLFPILRERVFTETLSITTPPNPYYQNMAWELLPPFTTYYVNLGAAGSHKLNALAVRNGGGIRVQLTIDGGTGIGVYTVTPYNNANAVLLKTSAQICPPVPIGRQKSDILGMLTGAIGSVTSGAVLGSAGGALGAIAGAVTGIGGAVIGAGKEIINSNAINLTGSIGSMGSILTGNVSLDLQCIQPQPENNAELGRPLCQNRVLGTLSGYTLCADGEIEAPMYDEERKAITRYLTTGFYME